MKFLPTRRLVVAATPVRDVPKKSSVLGRGMDFALMVLLFLGIGYALDRWLGTRPVFMIALVVFAVVGQFVKLYYEYTATMAVLEAQRAAGRNAQVGSR